MTKGKLVTTRDDGSVRTDYLFRVSTACLIYNPEGKLLVVKEHGWGLPGGGMDFGETLKEALARELFEEVGYKGEFDYEVVDALDPIHVKSIDAQQVYVVCHVVPEHYNFSPGTDAEEVRFIDPSELNDFADVQAERAYQHHLKLQERLCGNLSN